MTDERTLPDRLQRPGESAVQLADILAVAEWSRKDLADTKAELMAVIVEDRRARRDWEIVHAQEHVADEGERKVWTDKLATLLHAEEIAKARRDGILGAVRFVFNLVGSNWRGIVALAGFVGILLGNIHVSFGTPA